MINNMGTPGRPEGVPHWSGKELIAGGIRRSQQAMISGQPRHYGSPRLRTAQVITEAFPSAAVDWSDTWPFWYIVYNEEPHDGCDGGITLVDLVRTMGADGAVRVEDGWVDFWLDIAIYRKGEVNPALVLEVVDTSEPSQRKLAAFKERGVEAYKVNMKDIGGNFRTWLKYNPMLVSPLVTNRCGQKQRDTVAKMVDYWDSLIGQGCRPWIGYYHYPTGTKSFAYGVANPLFSDDGSGRSWTHGQPEVMGIERDVADWGGPIRCEPAGSHRTLTKTEWMDCLAYLRVATAAMANRGELQDPFMMAIGKYGAEVMAYAYP